MKIYTHSIIAVILCTVISFNVKAQNNIGQIWNCNTVSSKNLKSLSIVAEAAVDTTPKVINAFVHILRRTDGTGGLTQNQIDNWLSLLCSDYIQHHIIVDVMGQSFLNNTTYYNGITDTNYASLVSTDTHSNAIDVYLLSPNDTYSRAVDIPGIALAAGGSYAGTSVLSHEFGHCLGLFHTHSGRGCNDNANCVEYVDESNCETCGDLVCDTPADPCLSGNVNTNCEYIGDPSFSPDVHNIMSYAPPVCLNDLTNGQTIRIHSTISSNSIFTNRSYKPTISGPTLVCSYGANFTINNLPPVDSIIWSCGPNLIVSSGQNTDTCTISATGNGYSSIGVRLVTGCGDITLPQVDVVAGSPKPGPITIQMDAPPHRFTAGIDAVPTANSYNWYLDGVLNTTYHGTSAIFNRVSPYCGNWYGVEVEEINDCGTSAKTSGLAVEPDCF